MQLVNTFDIPFGIRLPVGHRVHSFAAAFWREITRLWVWLRNALPESAAPIFHSTRIPTGRHGYYGGAYDRLIASAPIVSCAACIGADPFPRSSISPRGVVTPEKADCAPRPDNEDDIWLAVLRSDFLIPARMM